MRKIAVRTMDDLINVLNRRGEDVGCLMDAEFYARKYIDGEFIEPEITLKPEAYEDDYGEWTIRVCCGDEKGSKHYARKIVAWAFHRNGGPDKYDTFRTFRWEGDHLIDSDEGTVTESARAHSY